MAFSNIANKETEQKCLSHFCDFFCRNLDDTLHYSNEFIRKVYDRHLNDPKNRGGQT